MLVVVLAEISTNFSVGDTLSFVPPSLPGKRNTQQPNQEDPCFV